MSKIFYRPKNNWQWAVVLVLSGGVILWLMGLAGDYWQVKNFTERQDFRSARDYLNYERIMKKAYQSDAVGGKTPEETLQLFITALEKGDYDLASKYFVPDKQGEMREALGNWDKAGKMREIIDYFNSNEKKLSSITSNEATITIAIRGEASMVVDLLLNSFTKVWKIASL